MTHGPQFSCANVARPSQSHAPDFISVRHLMQVCLCTDHRSFKQHKNRHFLQSWVSSDDPNSPPPWVFKKNDFLRRLNKKYVNQYKIIQIQSHKIYHLCFLVTNLFKLAPNGASMLVVRQDGRIENGQKSLARFIILDFHKIRLQNFGALLHAQKQKNNFFNFQAHCALLVILMQTWLDHNSPPPSWLFQLAE